VIGALAIARATARRLLETRIEGRPLIASWDALGDYLQATMVLLAEGWPDPGDEYTFRPQLVKAFSERYGPSVSALNYRPPHA
jgi:hypothetical protein